MSTTVKEKLILEIDSIVTSVRKLFSALSEQKINEVPYENSWTAGQLIRHITKSTDGMTKALLVSSKQTDRDPAERVEELKKAFLDYSTQMKSPDFIVPEEIQYSKQESINEMENSFDNFKKAVNEVEFSELIENLPLGPITKLEIIHFVLYHTTRHLQQLKRICNALEGK